MSYLYGSHVVFDKVLEEKKCTNVVGKDCNSGILGKLTILSRLSSILFLNVRSQDFFETISLKTLVIYYILLV
jgi:hypothetical protein